MAAKRNNDNPLVYSSEGGRISPASDRDAGPAPADGVVRVSRETKGRKGKGVTLITGVPLGGAELKDLARELKRKCGTGGTVKDGVIEIQGDHRDALVEALASKGWTVKKSGG